MLSLGAVFVFEDRLSFSARPRYCLRGVRSVDVTVSAAGDAVAPSNFVVRFSRSVGGLNFYCGCKSRNISCANADVCEFVIGIKVEYHVAGSNISHGGFAPCHSGLSEEFISNEGRPAAATKCGAATESAGHGVLIHNFGDAVAVGVASRTKSGIASAEIGGRGILGLELVQNGRDIALGNGLPVGKGLAGRRCRCLGFALVR